MTAEISRVNPDDSESRRFEISISSEAVVQRMWGGERLVHNEDSVDRSFLASGNAPLLLQHDTDRQIGVVEELLPGFRDGKLRAVVRFGNSSLAEEIFRDVADGIRSNVSIAYRIDKVVKWEDKKGYDVTRWRPLEVSFVSIPADEHVGIGRSDDNSEGNIMDKPEINKEIAEVNAAARAAATADGERIIADARAKANAIASAITLGASHGIREKVDEFISKQIPADANADQVSAMARGFILDNLPDSKPLVRSDVGMTKKEVKQFSVVRLVRAMGDTNPVALREAEFELSACAAAADKAEEVGARSRGDKFGGGYRLPEEVMRNWLMDPEVEARAQNTTTNSDLIPTEHMAGSFIDLLRARTSVLRAGVRVLNGLSGNLHIPRQTSGSTATWISAEGGDSTETSLAFDAVQMSPKDLSCFVDMTRRMMQQSSPDIEMLVRSDILIQMVIALDKAGLEGTAASGQPRGILNTSGVLKPTSFAAATPTWEEIVAMETALDVALTLSGNLAYIGRANMRGALKTKLKSAGIAGYIMTSPDELNGYSYYASEAPTDGNLYFGNWSDELLGLWSGLELVVDNAALAKSGGRRILAFQTADYAVRRPTSFAYNNDGV